jgi:penicillin-binding protein 2
METEGDRFRIYTRRAVLLGGGQLALATVLAGRMYYLAVVESSQYSMLAEDNRVSMRILSPTRGEILDRVGNPLAINRKDYRVFLIPEQAGDMDKTLQHLQLIYPLTNSNINRIKRQITRQRAFLPVTIAENLTWKEFSLINVETPHLPGIKPDAGETRFYPNGKVASHVVGYVGPVTRGDRSSDTDPALELPGFKVGRGGLEKTFDGILRGQAGDAREEVNAYGRVIRELARQDGTEGEGVVLTLDIKLQQYIHERFGDESAAAVVMDINNGDILAMHSTPNYDSNDFNLGFSRQEWDNLRMDKRHPLVNKATAGQYPPGSTFKMVVALAALKAGIIKPSEKIECTGKHEFGDRFFHCWEDDGHGKLNMVDAIAHSCDVYFYEIANRVGIAKINEMAAEFGLGRSYDIGLAGEMPGLLPSPAWKRAQYGTGWRAGETLIVGIGQGAVLTTPLQLAVMTARLANGKKAIVPRLVHSIGGVVVKEKIPEDLIVNDEHLAYIRRGMEKVHEPGGTAYGSRMRGKENKMAGKTGTSQVRAISQQQRDDGLENRGEVPWEERDHAVFVGFAPVDNPRYAVAVLVEHGGGGSRVAAPIARDIMQKVLDLDPSAKPPIDINTFTQSNRQEV